MREPLHDLPSVNDVPVAPARALLPGPVELLKNAWAWYRARFVTLMLVMLVPALTTIAVVVYLNYAPPASVPHFLVHPAVFLLGIVETFATIALLHTIVVKEKVPLYEAYRMALEDFFPYLWTVIVMTLAVAFGFVLLVIPGVMFSMWFAFSLFVYIVERKVGWEALKQSRRYVSGYWFAVFGRYLFLLLISIAVSVLVGILLLPLQFLPAFSDRSVELAGTIIGFALAPFFVEYLHLLYRALRLAHRHRSYPTT